MRPRDVVMVVAALLATAVVARWWMSKRSGAAPWCVWAAPTGSMLTWATPPIPEFGDVRDAPGGRSLDSDWSTCVTQRLVDGKPGASVAGLMLRGNAFLRWLGFLHDVQETTTWESTGVERSGPDGRKATAFVRSGITRGLAGPSPDASAAGSWDLDDGSGTIRRLRLNADGVVAGAPGVVWGVRDGALVIDHGPLDALREPHDVDTYVLCGDHRSFEGTALHPVHGKKVE